MIRRVSGGMVEFIPSPMEKRKRVIEDNTLELLWNLHQRLRRVEGSLELLSGDPERFERAFERIRLEEAQIKTINESLLAEGVSHE